MDRLPCEADPVGRVGDLACAEDVAGKIGDECQPRLGVVDRGGNPGKLRQHRLDVRGVVGMRDGEGRAMIPSASSFSSTRRTVAAGPAITTSSGPLYAAMLTRSPYGASAHCAFSAVIE